MVTLPEELKQAIVEQLASFGSYAEVARAVSSEWGVDVSRFQVRTYDPTNARFAGGERWRLLFAEHRRRYLDGLATLPVVHVSYRLAELQELYSDAKRRGNVRLAAALLRQAAEEVDRTHR